VPDLLDVDAPDGDLATSPLATQVRPSVVEVLGTASSCDRALTGSGFVYAPERVMTNAHVVAGVDDVFVRIGGTGRPLRAEVVTFDPDIDVAVLAVPGLTGPLLRFEANPPERGDDAVVVGFPGGRAYTVGSARVRSVIEARGFDIYDSGRVTREIIAIRGTVRSGNSGGPLLDPQGRVLGVVFAASVDDPQTGYALSAAQVQDDARLGVVSTLPVDTGPCA
jgi:S1-C subfamily serine protease